MADWWMVPAIVILRLSVGSLIGVWAQSWGRRFRIWLGISLLAGVIPTAIVLALLGRERT